MLQVADNFSRQYSHLCPDRMPLFLHPLNECEVPVRLGGGGRGCGKGQRAEGGGLSRVPGHNRRPPVA